MSVPDLHLLRPAIEAALAVARQGEADDPPVPAPPLLRPFLSFARLPAAALAVARRVVDDDEAFRARVRAAATETDVGPLGWLWLDRPDGWAEALADAAGATARPGDDDADDEAGGPGRRGRRAHIREAVTARARQAAEELERLRHDASELRRANRRLAGELERTESQLVSLSEDRTQAVRQLKAVEASLAERVAESRRHRDEASDVRRQLTEVTEALARAEEALAQARAEAAAGPAGASGAPAPVELGGTGAGGRLGERVAAGETGGFDLPRAAHTVAEAAQAAAYLARALGDLAGALLPLPAEVPVTAVAPVVPAPPDTSGPSPPRAAPDWPPVSPAGPTTSPPAPLRRRPVRLARGTADDTPLGAEHLARLSGVVFLVDGYNVSKTGWPDLDLPAQRLRLVNAVAELRVRLGTRVELVFDGNAEGRSFTRALPSAVRVWFSPEGVEADDLILSLVDEQPPDRPLVVVSSDRRVRDGAARRGASVLSSSTFLCLLR